MLFRRCLAVLFGAFVLGVPCRASADALVLAPFLPPSDVIVFTISIDDFFGPTTGTLLNPNGTGYTVTVEIIGDVTVLTYTPHAPFRPFNFGFEGMPKPNRIPGMQIQGVDLFSQSSNQPLALPSTGVSDNPTGGSDFLVLFAQESLQGGGAAGEWNEVPFNPANSEITISNNESSPITLSNVGYLISPTEIPLDQLNATDLLPSSFLSLPSLDGAVVPSGGSTTASVAPEPATLALWTLGGVGLVLLRRRGWRVEGEG